MSVRSETDTIDPRSLSRQLMERELVKILSGCTSSDEAEERIRASFTPKPQIWVTRRGERQFAVLIQIAPGEPNWSYVVPSQ